MQRATFHRPARLVALALLTSFALASSVHAIEGRLRLLEDGKDRTAREARSAVIWLEPQRDAPVEPMPEQEMTMQRKEFEPRVLVVTQGTAVRFPNRDPILHNVFSVSGKNRFDLGLYRGGDGKTAVFDHPGVVRVFCNVHHAMVAYIAVVDTPYHLVPSDGTFSFDDVPPGPARLTVWHERADPKTLDLQIPTDRSIDITLELTKPRVPRHRNKFGEPYSRRSRGRAY
ncbi:MAG: carboxypeptidase regulatory-like domain-containing protein [Acidobacteriota bacterium]